MYNTTEEDLLESDTLVYLGQLHGIDMMFCTSQRMCVLNGKPRKNKSDPWDAVHLRLPFVMQVFDAAMDDLRISELQLQEIEEYVRHAADLLPRTD
jgi:hypothetical protein